MGMTSGGGFESGDDFVAARVSIDVPTEGLSSLKEMSTEILNFRTAVTQAARGSESFLEYLRQVAAASNAATEAQRTLSTQLMRTAELQQRTMTGGAGMSAAQTSLPLSRAAPQGYVDPWAGMGVGMGGSRPSTTPSAYQETADATRQDDPRKYINAQAGRSRVRPGDIDTGAVPSNIDWNQQADRVEARDRAQRQQVSTTGRPGIPGTFHGGIAGNIRNEVDPFGGRPPHGMGLPGKVLDEYMKSRATYGADPGGSGPASAEKKSESKGGMLDGAIEGLGVFGKLLGPAAPYVAAATAALGVVEKAGSYYQNFKNLGSIRGGGAGEGLKDQARIITMGLNPFLSMDQARQVVMAGLTEGYSGKQFDDVTHFMSKNLRDMNISVSDSVAMLRKNVAEGGDSIGNLTKNLKGLKDEAAKGITSLPDLQASFQQTTGALTNMGAGGAGADTDARIAGEMFNTEETRGLKGVFAPLMTGMASSAAGSAMMMQMGGGQKIPGLIPQEYAAYMEANHPGEMAQVTSNTIQSLVNQFFNSPESRNPKSPQYFNKLFIMSNYLAGMGVQMNQSQLSQLVQQYLRDGNEQFAAAAGRAHATVSANLAPRFPGSVPSSGSDVAPVMKNLIGQAGAGGISVTDGSGNSSPLTGSPSQVKGLQDGDLTWSRGGEQAGRSLADLRAATQSSAPAPQSSVSQTNVNFSPAQVKISFSEGAVTASPNPVQLTPNQQQAGAGVGNATMNNPPPGDGFGYYRGKFANGFS